MSDTNSFNQVIIDEFRASEGKVGGGFAGVPVVLLSTKGAKSGKTRVNPLAGQPQDDGTIYVFASAAGSPKHPDWYHNLVANPRVTVEVGDERFEADATVADGEERDRLFAKQVSVMPGFGEYQAKAGRVIPVVILTRT
jgi:deazaflavin-dependent oxidoreductase (nitroreductase family)